MTTSTDYLTRLKSLLNKIDSDLSYDQLPNRYSVTTALSITNSLIDIDTLRRTGSEVVENIHTVDDDVVDIIKRVVTDEMYDNHETTGKKYNEDQIFVSLPNAKLATGDDDHTIYKTDIVMLTTDETGVLYPTKHFPHTEWEPFVISYDGQWCGNGEVFQSEVYLSIDKETLLDVAEEAVSHTGNQHHIFLEGISLVEEDDDQYLKDLPDGVHQLKLQFGS